MLQAKSSEIVIRFRRPPLQLFNILSGSTELSTNHVSLSIQPGEQLRDGAPPTGESHFKSWRVTLTLPVLLIARETIFLAAGRQKAPVIARILGASGTQSDLPASMVSPAQGRVWWMLDEAAASLIPHASGGPVEFLGGT